MRKVIVPARMGRRWTAMICLAVTSALSLVGPVASEASPAPPGMVLKDIAYAPAQPASSRGHLLDLYLPGHARHPAPLVIFTHGSGWLAENGRQEADVAAARLGPLG